MEEGKIISVNFPTVKEIGDYFLASNRYATRIDCQSAERIGHGFLDANEVATDINLSKAKYIGNYCCRSNTSATHLDFQSAENIGSSFFGSNEVATHINLLKVKRVNRFFFASNKSATHLDFRNLEVMYGDFFRENEAATFVDISNVKEVWDGCFDRHKHRKKIIRNKRLDLKESLRALATSDKQLEISSTKKQNLFQKIRGYLVRT